jgi:hypothetical protein
VASLAKIINTGVDDNGALGDVSNRHFSITYSTYSNDALWADQFDELIGGASLGISLTIIFQVAQVTNMAHLVFRSAVFLSVWVDCLEASETTTFADLE